MLTKRALFVLDGSKALGKEVRETFDPALHPAQAHERALLSSPELARRSEAAPERGLGSRESRGGAPGAQEGAALAQEDQRVDRREPGLLGIGGTLRKTLLTTNPVESAIEVVKPHPRRVKRWNGSMMVLRWVGSGLVRAEQQFRRVKSHEKIAQLVTALENVSLKNSKDVA